MATGEEQKKEKKQTLTQLFSGPGFPGGAGGGFPTKGSDYPGGAASSYYNTYASFYSQTGAPYRYNLSDIHFVQIQLMQDSKTRWSQSCGQRQWTVNGGKGDTELSPKKLGLDPA